MHQPHLCIPDSSTAVLPCCVKVPPVGKQISSWVQATLLDNSLTMGRPMLVLFEVANRGLHWAVVVGQERAIPNNLLLLNSNSMLYIMTRQTLQSRMDLGNHITGSLPIVSDRIGRFNSMSCTWGSMPADIGGHHMRNQVRKI